MLPRAAPGCTAALWAARTEGPTSGEVTQIDARARKKYELVFIATKDFGFRRKTAGVVRPIIAGGPPSTMQWRPAFPAILSHRETQGYEEPALPLNSCVSRPRRRLP